MDIGSLDTTEQRQCSIELLHSHDHAPTLLMSSDSGISTAAERAVPILRTDSEPSATQLRIVGSLNPSHSAAVFTV
jgi:hypothetical protein